MTASGSADMAWLAGGNKQTIAAIFSRLASACLLPTRRSDR